MKLFKSKKGDAVSDTITILIVIFVFAFISLLTYKSFMDSEQDITAMLNDSSNLARNESLASINTVKNDFPGIFDGAMITILVGLWIFALISAYFIDSHPIFMILSVILLVFVLIAAAIIGNVGQELIEDSEFDSIRADFPITTWILNHMLAVVLVISFSIVLVLYGKNRGG